jgi:4-diphosphocytidyl-2-C-methyl-D-erythritol kinase
LTYRPSERRSSLPARRPLDRVVVRAPAKLNLHLSAGALRSDGFHDLTTVYQAVGLYDEVEIERADALSVTVTGDMADQVPADAGNLAARAVTLLAQETGNAPHVRITIRKGIPVSGGCAGGSADAAAGLVGADALWGTALPKERMATLAARLGSDVPFAVHGGTALGTGRGERLTPVLAHGEYAWVLAVAEGGLSTPAVYAELDRQRGSGRVAVVGDPAGVLAALRAGNAALLGRALSNDLQPAAVALRPALRLLLSAGRDLGALGVLVSGSGPTVALLARDGGHGEALAAALARDGRCRRAVVAAGPVPGARVVGEQ